MNPIYYPDPRLRRRASPLPDASFGTPALRRFAQQLANCLAPLEMVDVLAANHTDFEHAWRILALKTPAGISILCNPVIKSSENEVPEFEASSPFLGIPVQLPAPRKLVVEYRGIEGERKETECDPGGARAVWQGVNSLDGKLIIDRMTPMGAIAYVSKYRRQIEKKVTLVS